MHFYYDYSDEIVGFEYFDGTTVEYYTYVKNMQGDVVAIIDSDGVIDTTYEYDAWGRFGGSSGGLDVINPIRYRGYYYDEEISMYYLQSRYYDPAVGRFINADDTDYIGYTETVLSYNIYTYCENNSIKNIDPTGNVLIVKTKNKKYRNKIFNLIDKIYGFDFVPVKNKSGTFEYKIPRYLNFRQLSFQYKHGSRLIDTIIKSRYTVVITMNNNGDNYTQFNINTCSMNGVGTGSTININKVSNAYLYVRNKKNDILVRKAPQEIILAHELIHALHGIRGERYSKDETEENMYVFSINAKFHTEYDEMEMLEELYTIGVEGFSTKDELSENKIRSEHGYLERLSHYGRQK